MGEKRDPSVFLLLFSKKGLTLLKIQSMKVDIPMPTPQHEEVLKLMLQRANIDLELVLREGIARFINNNLDVLAPNEIEKFKNVCL